MKWFFMGIVVNVVLIFLFDAINPRSWPSDVMTYELLGFWLIVLVCALVAKGMEEKQKAETEQRRAEEERQMEKFLAELRSQGEVELEKHRMTLEAAKQGKPESAGQSS